MNILQTIKKYKASFDPRLNDYKWMHHKYRVENKTTDEISSIIGCSPKKTREKLIKHNLPRRDTVMGVYTGRFHSVKQIIMKLLKDRYMVKIEQYIDEVYPYMQTNNARVLDDIFKSAVVLDDDDENSSGSVLGMSRKETYTLVGKFGLCLLDYDSYYEERINYLLQEIIRRQDEFSFDESSNPDNWYPHRDIGICAKHLVGCREKKE